MDNSLKFEYNSELGKIVGKFTNPVTGEEETHIFSDSLQKAFAQSGELNASPFDGGASAVQLPHPSTSAAAAEPADVAGNPWFNNTYAVTLATAMLKMVQANKYQRIVDANNSVSMMKLEIELAYSIGEAILQSAKIEANIHKMEAIMAGVGIGITLASTSISIVGLGLSAAGTAKMKAADPAGGASAGTTQALSGASASTNFAQGLKQQAQGEQIKMVGEGFGKVGDGITNIVINAYKAGAIVEKAKWDRNKAILEGRQRVLDNVLHDIQSDMEACDQAINKILDTLTQIRSENARRFLYTGH